MVELPAAEVSPDDLKTRFSFFENQPVQLYSIAEAEFKTALLNWFYYDLEQRHRAVTGDLTGQQEAVYLELGDEDREKLAVLGEKVRKEGVQELLFSPLPLAAAMNKGVVYLGHYDV